MEALSAAEFIGSADIFRWGAANNTAWRDYGHDISFPPALLSTWRALLQGDLTTSSATCWAKETLGIPIFLDPSREQALAALLDKVVQLISSELISQRSCFLWLGPRGIGKSCFMKAIAAAISDFAPKSTLVVYTNWISAGILSPAQLIVRGLKAAHVPLSDACLSSNPSIDVIHMELNRLNKCAILFLDGLETLYKEDTVERLAVWRQLHNIGEYQGTPYYLRRIIVVAGGSAAVLRKLAFCSSGVGELQRTYPLSARTSSLNNPKIVTFNLRPLTTTSHVKTAIMAYASSSKAFHKLATSIKLISSRSSNVAAGAGAVDVHSTTVVDESLAWRMNVVSRGSVGYFDVAVQCLANTAGVEKAHSERVITELEAAFHVPLHGGIDPHSIFRAMLAKLNVRGDEPRLLAETEEGRIAAHKVSLHSLINTLKHYTKSDVELALHDAADNRLLLYDDATGSVEFLRPSDPACWILFA